MHFLTRYRNSDKEIYLFLLDGIKLHSGLRNRQVHGLIRPSTRLPRKRTGPDPVGGVWVTVDLTKAVCQITQQLNVDAGQYTTSLKRLFNLIEAAAAGYFHPDQVLPAILNSLSNEYDVLGTQKWAYMLEDFVFLTRLLGDNVLCGSKPLRDGLTKWLVSACWVFASEARLSVSLQFIDLCNDNTVFESAMEQLIYYLKPRKMLRLIESQGNIALFLSGAPSNRIIAFMRDYYGFESNGQTPVFHPFYSQLAYHPVHPSPTAAFGWHHH